MICLFSMTSRIIKKLPLPMKRGTVFLIKVKSLNALLCMLLVCTSTHLKSVLRYKFLILDTHHMDTPFHEQGCEDL